VITAFGAKPVRGMRDLAMAVAETPAGRLVDVAILRDTRRQTLAVRIGQEQARTALLQ
jgi:S1-C subfamily serine protease